MDRTFRIADHYVTVSTPGAVDSLSLLPSFRPFVCEPTDDGERLFSITLDDSLQPVPKSQREHVHDFGTPSIVRRHRRDSTCTQVPSG